MNASDLKGTVDFGVLTIREDEYAAVLRRMPRAERVDGRRRYRVCRLPLRDGSFYTIAAFHCLEQGNTEALNATRDLMEDLQPAWILVVGIAGAVPSSEHTLGDVIVSTRISDFCVEAVLKDHTRTYALGGGPLHPEAARIAADVGGMVAAGELDGWNEASAIGKDQPPVDFSDEMIFGDDDWRKAVRSTIGAHFPENNRRLPRVTTGAIASSDRLIKDPEILNVWLRMARQVQAIEMESAGVYRAVHGRVPFLAIRGISDVVGLKRDPNWTAYACETAASFMHAFLLSRPVPAHQTGRSRSVHGGESPLGGAGRGILEGSTEPPIAGKPRRGSLPPRHCQVYVSRGAVEAELCRSILGQPGKAIAITGMGGSGKTELAREIAEKYASKHSGGVLWVPVGDKSLADVQAFMARQLELTLCSSCTIEENAEAIRAALNSVPRLVVFDDVRRRSTEDFSLCLPPIPPCSVIATSRNQTFSSLPPGAICNLTAMSPAEALKLLKGVPGLDRILKCEREAAKELVERCGCHPLALTLAARRLILRRNDSPTPVKTFVASMKNRLEALRIDGQGSQSSIEGNLRLSYEELELADQRRFRALAGFAATGFCLHGAAALWRQGESDSRRTLERFQSLSLVMEGASPGRFRCHDLLHEFACAEASACGENAEWMRLSAEWLIGSFENASPARPELGAELADEFDNILWCAAWAAEAGNAELLARLTTTTSTWFTIMFALWGDWERYLTRALEIGVTDARLRARVHHCLGEVLTWRSIDAETPLSKIEEHCIAAKLDFEALGDRKSEAAVLASLGNAFLRAENHGPALAAYQEAARAYRESGDLPRSADALQASGDAQKGSRSFKDAEASYTQALALFREVGDALGAARALEAKGTVFQEQDQFELARQSYIEAVDLFLKAGARLAGARLLSTQADLEAKSTGAVAAKTFIERSLEQYRAVRRDIEQADPFANPDVVFRMQKDLGDRDPPCQRHFLLNRDLLVPCEEAMLLNRLGDIQEAEGDRIPAFESRYEALIFRYGMDLRVEGEQGALCGLHVGLAKLLLSMKSIVEAHIVLAMAAKEVGGLCNPDLAAEVGMLKAEVSARMKEPGVTEEANRVLAMVSAGRGREIAGLLMFGRGDMKFESRG